MAWHECPVMQVQVFYDRTGNTLTVWFGDPRDEYVCEETGDEVVLMKDKAGQVIGFEKLNFSGTDFQGERHTRGFSWSKGRG